MSSAPRRRRTYMLLGGGLILFTFFLLSRRLDLSTMGSLSVPDLHSSPDPAANQPVPDPAKPAQEPVAKAGPEQPAADPAAPPATEPEPAAPPPPPPPPPPAAPEQKPPAENPDDKPAAEEKKPEAPKTKAPEAADLEQKPIIAIPPMSYGTAVRPPFKGMKNVFADLPAEYLPAFSDVSTGGGAGHKAKRLVFVGDVHGQIEPFRALLEKVRFDANKGDHLILTGDMVNKGPDSAAVVQLAMDLGASAVRGNHEDRVLLSHAAVQSHLTPTDAETPVSVTPSASPAPAANASTHVDPALVRRDNGPLTLDNLEQEPFAHGDQGDRLTAESLSDAQLEWLASLPVVLRVGSFPGALSPPWDAGQIVVAHAGLVPGVPLEQQDPWAAMNVRTLVYPAGPTRLQRVRDALNRALKEKHKKAGGKGDPPRATDAEINAEIERIREARRRQGLDPDPDTEVAVPIEGRDGKPWAAQWNAYQNNAVVDPAERVVVVYGHDAKEGLKVGDTDDATGLPRYAFGLDSGCVYGRQLSALVVELQHGGKVAHDVVQVACKDAVGKDAD